MFCSCKYPWGLFYSPRQSGGSNLFKCMSPDILQECRQNDGFVFMNLSRSRTWVPSTIQAVVKAPCVCYEVHSDFPLQSIPKHVAVIMDGNGRWASERGHVASVGHKSGIDALQTVVEGCIEFGVKYLSVFALSTENIASRNEQEINFLVDLVYSVVRERLNKLHAQGVRLKFVGGVSSLGSDSLSSVIQRYAIKISFLPSDIISLYSVFPQCRAEGLTENNDTLVLTIALNFSGREDIVAATRSIAKRIQDESLDIRNIDATLISQNLALCHIPKEHQSPDLLIRTGGEKRISNFVLWHLAYTELHFTDVYWPDFSRNNLLEALIDYSHRDRRYGARSTNHKNL